MATLLIISFTQAHLMLDVHIFLIPTGHLTITLISYHGHISRFSSTCNQALPPPLTFATYVPTLKGSVAAVTDTCYLLHLHLFTRHECLIMGSTFE